MGEWVERDPGYLSFEVHNCTYCGKMIPRHIWYEDVAGQRKPFCKPDCFRRYAQRQGDTTPQASADPDSA